MYHRRRTEELLAYRFSGLVCANCPRLTENDNCTKVTP